MATKKPTTVEKIKRTALELYRVDLADVKRSKKWFDEKIASMNKARVTPSSIMLKDGGPNLTGTLKPASMYAFYYDPKGKEDLPYYDQFPLIFPFHKDATGFIGLNMHYLDYPKRFELFRALLKVANAKNLNESSKMKLNWDMIKGVSKLAPAQACVKRYLNSHVKSPFLYIDPTEWTTALTLPLERFQKATKQQVWKDSAQYRSW